MMSYINKVITYKYLLEHPNEVFVFGDNTLRRGKKGAALLRDEPNAYGFITKKYPSYNNDAYYKPSEYRNVFIAEIKKLKDKIINNPNKIYLISKLGAGLANKYRIWQKIIQKGLDELRQYDNVRFLF